MRSTGWDGQWKKSYIQPWKILRWISLSAKDQLPDPLRLKLPRFTVIGATTRLALVTSPLRARFGAVYRLDFYDLACDEEDCRYGAPDS